MTDDQLRTTMSRDEPIRLLMQEEGVSEHEAEEMYDQIMNSGDLWPTRESRLSSK